MNEVCHVTVSLTLKGRDLYKTLHTMEWEFGEPFQSSHLPEFIKHSCKEAAVDWITQPPYHHQNIYFPISETCEWYFIWKK